MPHRCTNCGRAFADGSKEMLSGCPDCGGNKFQFAPKGSVDGQRAGSEASGSRPDAASDGADSSETAVSRAADTVRDWVSNRSGESDARAGSKSRSQAKTETSRSQGEAERSHPQSGSETSRARADGEQSDGFAEWPDSARRPEDRSTATESATAPTPESDEEADPTPDPGLVDDRGDEDSAQADARSELVSGDELPPRSASTEDASDSRPTDEPPEHGRVVSEPDAEDDRPSLEDLRAELNDQFESIKIVEPGQYELNLMELYDREEYIVSLQEDGRYVIDVPDSWRDGDGDDA